MFNISTSSRQLVRVAWTLDQLNHKQILLGLSMDCEHSCHLLLCYKLLSHILQNPSPLHWPNSRYSQLLHHFHFISLASVNLYLSGICNQLEPFYPDVWKHHTSVLVKCTLKGACHSQNITVQWKGPLMVQNLCYIHDWLTQLDNLLFNA